MVRTSYHVLHRFHYLFITCIMLLNSNNILRLLSVSGAFHCTSQYFGTRYSGIAVARGQLIEGERVDEYHRRGHVWPPDESEYTPNTPGWKKIFERRFKQIDYNDAGPGNKYQAYLTSVYSGLLSPSFTEKGWQLAKAPKELVDELKASLHRGLAMDLPTENEDTFEDIENPILLPLFHEDEIQKKLNTKVLHEMLPFHQEWAGVKLVPNNAYGLRIYRSQAKLLMHTDSPETHVISSILHVDHDDDPSSEPWPLVIEDFDGNINEVFLESGDMLFYESSKLLHGRPRRFNGKWYCSIFLHYKPEGWDGEKRMLDAHYRVPPGWYEDNSAENTIYAKDKRDYLEIISTNFNEPNCEDGFCGLDESLKRSSKVTQELGRELLAANNEL